LIWIRTEAVIYLLIIFVLALALAPLLHVVPSKYQRRVARLREFAAVNGMFVEFRHIPEGALSAAESAGHQPGRTIYYGLRIPASGRMERRRRAWVYGEEGWRSMPRGRSVPAPLADLPEGVFSVSIDEESCGIYWQESGEEAEIEKIYGVLERILIDD
jgi:hypothetical protein